MAVLTCKLHAHNDFPKNFGSGGPQTLLVILCEIYNSLNKMLIVVGIDLIIALSYLDDTPLQFETKLLLDALHVSYNMTITAEPLQYGFQIYHFSVECVMNIYIRYI